MQSDFLAACQHMRERMEIPAMPIAEIRRSARDRGTPQSNRRRTMAAALIASVSLAAAAGAAVLSGSHVWFTKSGAMNVSAAQFEVINAPTPAKLRTLASEQNFRVFLPAGLPEGTTIARADRFGAGALGISYNLPGNWRASHHLLRIIVANRDDVDAAAGTTERGYTFQTGPVQAHWRIGDEEVTALGYAATSAELANIKRAMLLGHE